MLDRVLPAVLLCANPSFGGGPDLILMAETGHTVHLEFPSPFEMIDLVQALIDQLGRMLGFDEDAQHWVGVAVRESVINAIKHGNRFDTSKLVDWTSR